MNATASPTLRLTAEEYLVRERLAASKSEFVDGVVYGMPGGSAKHSLIQTNVSSMVWNGVRNGACTMFSNDMKIWAPAENSYFYPDVSVVCGSPRYIVGVHQDAVENPKFILEVLSPSTERFDRTRKFKMYRSIPGFEQYVLVAQDEPRVEVFTRNPQGFWVFTDYTDLESVADFGVIGVQLPLATIYERIAFEPLPEG